MDFLSYFALVVLFLVILVIAYGIVAIHDIPYLMAKSRNHPHQDAIHYGGWVSLFTLHAIWPFLWIWAVAYHPEGGYAGRPNAGMKKSSGPGAQSPDTNQEEIAALKLKVAELEAALAKTNAPQSE